MSNQPPEELGDTSGLKDMLTEMFSRRTRKRPMKVADAFDYLVQEEESRLLDMELITRTAIERTEDSGIVFLDEIDKIAGGSSGHGPDISREGVQRDILPIVEGTTVTTKYGSVATDHILFIAAGAFHVSKPSGPHPRVAGSLSLFASSCKRSPSATSCASLLSLALRSSSNPSRCSKPKASRWSSRPEALEEMARFAFEVNETTENIGARRLHTIMERVLDEISFEAPDLIKAATTPGAVELGAAQSIGTTTPPLTDRTTEKGTLKVLTVDRAYVEKQVAGIVKNQDLSRYIL